MIIFKKIVSARTKPGNLKENSMIVRNKTSRKIIAFCWGVGIETSRDKTINPGESAKFDDLPLPKRYVVCCQEIEGSKDDFKMPERGLLVLGDERSRNFGVTIRYPGN